MTDGTTPTDSARSGGAPEDRWYLDDEREFLVRSLQDAEREHDAGDLSDGDFEVLVARDQKRLIDVESELAALAPETEHTETVEAPVPSEAPGRSEWRRVGIIAACFLIVAGILILVVQARHPRLPGQASSGSITLTKAQLIEQQLAQATALNNEHQYVPALKVYNEVLSEDPSNPTALAEAGWLAWNSGAAADVPTVMVVGLKDVEKAVRLSPTYYGGHLFLGVILDEQDGNAVAAVKQFALFLADNPPAQEVQQVASLLTFIYTKAGVAVPSQLTVSPTTTSTTTTSTTTTSTTTTSTTTTSAP